MRKIFLLMLLAGGASPTLARPDSDDGENRSVMRPHRAERGQQSNDDSQRREAPVARPQRNFGNDDGPRVERPAPVERERVAPVDRVERVERGSAGDNVRSWRRDSDDDMGGRVRKVEDHPTLPHRPTIERDTDAPAAVAGDSVRNWRERGRNGENTGSTIEGRNVRVAPGAGESGSLVQPRGRLPRVFDPTERRVSRTPVPGTEPPAPRTADTARAQPSTRWRTDWRHDRRYDWRDWRRRHRSHFHLGFYYDPFGWDYFRYGIGWRLWPSYYRSSYWLNDPWQYRLPRAYGPYRWIRYHNDALLVNIYSGSVVDVIYDFFW